MSMFHQKYVSQEIPPSNLAKISVFCQHPQKAAMNFYRCEHTIYGGRIMLADGFLLIDHIASPGENQCKPMHYIFQFENFFYLFSSQSIAFCQHHQGRVASSFHSLSITWISLQLAFIYHFISTFVFFYIILITLGNLPILTSKLLEHK